MLLILSMPLTPSMLLILSILQLMIPKLQALLRTSNLFPKIISLKWKLQTLQPDKTPTFLTPILLIFPILKA
jgi:hypothetical protein